MSEVIIRAEHVSKLYRLGESVEMFGNFRETLMALPRALMRRCRGNGGNGARPDSESSRELWALNDVSFEIMRGDVVGVIGRNGAGKSTLLKILSQITTPTEGKVDIYGRLSSLLEVGTGFHPELTGRENIYLNGSILGMRKTEIDRNFDEIVAFAEVEKFLDTPVKRYSSGMYVRLAFAVAAHLQPEVLVVDEVLAVGDQAFQAKCIGKMGEVARGGRTVLFVSHNMQAIMQLCGKCILLKSGRVHTAGETGEVCEAYLNMMNQAASPAEIEIPADCRVGIRRAWTTDGEGNPSNQLHSTRSFNIHVAVEVREFCDQVDVGIWVENIRGVRVFSSNLSDGREGAIQPLKPGAHEFSVNIPGNFLVPDHYAVFVKSYVPRVKDEHRIFDACAFTLIDTGSKLSRHKTAIWNHGCVEVTLPWKEISEHADVPAHIPLGK